MRKKINPIIISIVLILSMFSSSIFMLDEVVANTNNNTICYDPNNPIPAEQIRLNTPTIKSTMQSNGTNFRVEITYDSKSVNKYYSIDNGANWREYTQALTLSGNVTIQAYSQNGHVKSNYASLSTRPEVVPDVTMEDVDLSYGTPGYSFYRPVGYDISFNLINADKVTYKYEYLGISEEVLYSSGELTYNGSKVRLNDYYPNEPSPRNSSYYIKVTYKAHNTNNNVLKESQEYTKILHFYKQQPLFFAIPKLIISPSTKTNGSVNYKFELTNVNTGGYYVDVTHVWYSINGRSFQKYDPVANGEWLTTDENITIYMKSGNSTKDLDYTAYTSWGQITNIDRLPPNITHNLNYTSNGGIMMYLYSNEETSKIEYNYNGTWMTYNSNNAPTFLQPTTVQYRGTDIAGNTATVKSVTIGQDRFNLQPPTAPTFSYSETAKTNKNVIVTINYSSDSTVKKYSFDNVTWHNYTEPIVVQENTFIYAFGEKSSGSRANSIGEVYNIDKGLQDCEESYDTPPNNLCINPYEPTEIAQFSLNAPTVTHVPNSDFSESTVTITPDSRAKETYYSLDNINWVKYSSPFKVDTLTGYQFVYTYSKYEHMKSAVVSYTIMSQYVKPTVSMSVSTAINSRENLSGSREIVYYNNAISMSTNKPTNKMYYSTDLGTTWNEYTSSFNLNGSSSATGTINVFYYSIDTKGVKSTTQSQRVLLSETFTTTLPTPEVAFRVKQTPTEYTRGSVRVELEVSNYSIYSTSGNIMYRTSSMSNYIQYNSVSGISVSENTTIYYYYAPAGVATAKSHNVSNIDKDSPTITYSSSKGNNISYLRIFGSDYGSGLNKLEYSTNGGYNYSTIRSGDTIIINSPNDLVTIRATDNVGNVSISTYTPDIKLFDSTPPTSPIVNLSTKYLTRDDVKVDIIYSNDSAIKEYSFDNVTFVPYNGQFTVTKNTMLYAKAVDSSGNASYTTVNINNIYKNAVDCVIDGKLVVKTDNGINLPYKVFNASGIEVATGVTNVTPTHTLKAGEYMVRVITNESTDDIKGLQPKIVNVTPNTEVIFSPVLLNRGTLNISLQNTSPNLTAMMGYTYTVYRNGYVYATGERTLNWAVTLDNLPSGQYTVDIKLNNPHYKVSMDTSVKTISKTNPIVGFKFRAYNSTGKLYIGINTDSDDTLSMSMKNLDTNVVTNIADLSKSRILDNIETGTYDVTIKSGSKTIGKTQIEFLGEGDEINLYVSDSKVLAERGIFDSSQDAYSTEVLEIVDVIHNKELTEKELVALSESIEKDLDKVTNFNNKEDVVAISNKSDEEEVTTVATKSDEDESKVNDEKIVTEEKEDVESVEGTETVEVETPTRVEKENYRNADEISNLPPMEEESKSTMVYVLISAIVVGLLGLVLLFRRYIFK